MHLYAETKPVQSETLQKHYFLSQMNL